MKSYGLDYWEWETSTKCEGCGVKMKEAVKRDPEYDMFLCPKCKAEEVEEAATTVKRKA